jgi:YfiH family protein
VLGAETVLTAHQVHGTTAVLAQSAWPEQGRPRADAIVTTTPGLAIGVLTADCAPLLFADPEAGVVAAAHAGWRGALDGIAESTIEAMEKLGAERHRLRATIGPCIGADAYEVGWDFQQAFFERDSASRGYFSCPKNATRPHFDLSGYIANRLARAGVGVSTSNRCTFAAAADFFSFRRSRAHSEPDYGRQISAIVLT